MMISVNHVSKEFRIQKPKKGLKGYVKGLLDPQYDIVHAVNDISFNIGEGECVGYIGSNGAGKSTTMKMLCGILMPASGNISVNGLVPFRDRKSYCKEIGAVFGQRTQLWWDIPITETFELLKCIYRISEKDFSQNMELFYDVLDLGDFDTKPVRQLSLGQRVRADFACAMLHNPSLLYLDEPTIGLDVRAKERVRNFVGHIRRSRGVTIVLTTHDMRDIECLCERSSQLIEVEFSLTEH